MPTLSLQHRVERVTAPTEQPVTVADAKHHPRVEHSDDDLLIQRLIETAVAFVDVKGALGKAMITQTWAEWFAANPSEIILSLGSVQSVSSISYYDPDYVLQTATLSNFYVLGPSTRTVIKPKPGYAWPTTFTQWCEWLYGKRNSDDDLEKLDDYFAELIDLLETFPSNVNMFDSAPGHHSAKQYQ